uniref:Candidate secreted effector n=1 Tax=Meloidogyne incognita TaxID=6306 RepID=A0A914MTU7_MELIC
MNFLAKHFFDYQSVINLPHTAVQMHKMPPSQAGCDPSAAWAPKDLHVSGKNHAAPAARANRGYHGGDQRTGSHRHGRPSKLEFRNWGERHGELRSEKIIPHTEIGLKKKKILLEEK